MYYRNITIISIPRWVTFVLTVSIDFKLKTIFFAVPKISLDRRSRSVVKSARVELETFVQFIQLIGLEIISRAYFPVKLTTQKNTLNRSATAIDHFTQRGFICILQKIVLGRLHQYFDINRFQENIFLSHC